MCRIRRGGFFLETRSNTFNQTQDLITAGGAKQETQDSNAEAGIKDLVSSSLGGIDSLKFAGTDVVPKMPIGIPRQQWDNGYSTLHPLGLGPNSTYLNALVRAGTIASRVWSLYWGRMWTTNNPLNGSLILGGYDERKTNGQGFTSKLNYDSQTGCFTGLRVDIVDIVLNFRGGVDKSLFKNRSTMPACIVPTRQLLLQTDAGIVGNFLNATGIKNNDLAYDFHWQALQFDSSNVYDGDITIQLGSGLAVRVSNDQFVVPGVNIDRNGSRIFNTSSREVLLSAITSQATLGRYFLTAAYLSVNHDDRTFTLWKANPTSATSIKTISGSNNSACTNSTDPTNSASGSSGANSPDGVSSASPGNTSTPSSLSTAAIAGISIAGALVLVAVVVSSIIYLRRRRSKLRTVMSQSAIFPEEHKRMAELHESYVSSTQSHDQKQPGMGVYEMELRERQERAEMYGGSQRSEASQGGRDKTAFEMSAWPTPRTPLMAAKGE